MDGLAIANPHIPSGVQDQLSHCPVTAATLEASVVELVSSDEASLPDISEGYAVWREAFDAGESGYFTSPVAKIVEHIESVVAGPSAGN